MTRSPVRTLATRVAALTTALATALAAVLAGMVLAAPAQAANPVTPGDLTGHGFDQCLAPDQGEMDTWMRNSPFLAVGIYISGASRGCRYQPNLTPTWVRKQLRRGWRLLPITLGPQASCHPRFPRYGNDPVISPAPGNGSYPTARKQGRQEASRAVTTARELGISPGSTLWYDLEGFDATNTHCRESSLRFLHAWTNRVHKLGYVSGVYSSAASGIKMLDDARVERPGISQPDRVWIADWDGRANTSSRFVRSDGWLPGNRMKQYRGDHRETWGGVTINIDSNYLDLGNGTRPRPAARSCGTRINFGVYRVIKPRRPRPAQLRALQCMLRHKGFYEGAITGSYDRSTRQAVRKFRSTRPGGDGGHRWTRRNWMQLHAIGSRRVLKVGSNGARVRRLQRVLNSAANNRLAITAVFDEETEAALEAYQREVRVPVDGIVTGQEWRLLKKGIPRR